MAKKKNLSTSPSKTKKKENQSTTNTKTLKTSFSKEKASSSPCKSFIRDSVLPMIQRTIQAFKTLKFSSLSTLGPLGFFPKGSGTIGALVSLPLAYLLVSICPSLLWIVTAVLFVLGLFSIKEFTRNLTEKDPGCVIIDEVVGQLVTFMVVLPDFMHWPMLIFGFALFRFFDIFKFGAVAYWDRQKTPLGVMMDDITAGIFSGFILSMMQVLLVEIFGM